jgi:hypothetical protein
VVIVWGWPVNAIPNRDALCRDRRRKSMRPIRRFSRRAGKKDSQRSKAGQRPCNQELDCLCVVGYKQSDGHVARVPLELADTLVDQPRHFLRIASQPDRIDQELVDRLEQTVTPFSLG